ncbi:MAG: hypothetical protein WBQ66_15680, partial [Blastocatellia bacterium]
TVAARLKEAVTSRRPYGLVVVAEGTTFVAEPGAQVKPSSLKASLSPLATGEASDHVIQRSGHAAEITANRLQLMLAYEVYPLVLGPWVRGGAPTAVDRQLGIAYGAGAVRALSEGQNGVMVAFAPPNMAYVPLADAINKVRTVPTDSMFLQVANSLGICLGRKS